jgi:uncharacterized membrane protein
MLRSAASGMAGSRGVEVLYAVEGFFTKNGLFDWGFRFIHIVAGIAWIGLLYYFNFVQVPAFAEYGDNAAARNVALDKIARRALWWFRWAALLTFLTGIIIVAKPDYWQPSMKLAGNTGILTGMLLGTIMLLNVWGVIWRNQKVVLANAVNVLAGQPADPNAAAAGRRAFMASRQNTIFSISLVWFMTFKSHSPYSAELMSGGKLAIYWIITLIIVAILEVNALGLLPWKFNAKKGINTIYESVQNALIAGFALWAVFLVFWEIIIH